jgi:DNA-binding NtrC family response regulator
MAASATILIADRNSHVRMFLMREMMADGYRVKLAANGENVLKMTDVPGNIDLLIIDPDLPGLDAVSLLAALREKNPNLPILLHVHQHLDDEEIFLDEKAWFTIIEKAGDSVERIKEAVGQLLPPPASKTPQTAPSMWREGDAL